MPTASTADAPVLVLVLDPDTARLDSVVRALSRGVYSKIMTCNNPLGCLDLALRFKPKIVFIHSSEAMVEDVSLIKLIKALSPHADVRVID